MAWVSLGGESFRVEAPFSLAPDPEDHVRAFVGAAPSAADMQQAGTTAPVPVRVRINALTADTGKQLFDGQSWTLTQAAAGDRGEYAVTLRRNTPEREPLWRARFGPAVDAVDVDLDPWFATLGRGGSMAVGAAPVDPHAPVPTPFRYPLDQLLLMYRLARAEHESADSAACGLIVHGAGVVRDGVAHVFPGVSGAGKTTLSRCLESDSKARILSDDRIVLRRTPTGLRAYGTPWPGEGGHALPESAPLGQILFIEKQDHDSITPLEPAQALRRLMKVASIPWFDAPAMGRCLSFAEELLGATRWGRFGFTPTDGAAAAFQRHLQG